MYIYMYAYASFTKMEQIHLYYGLFFMVAQNYSTHPPDQRPGLGQDYTVIEDP